MAYCLCTQVTLRMGQNQRRNEMMAKLVPYMARQGWKLVLGLAPFLGDFCGLKHVWEIEQFSDIEKGLLKCYTDPEAAAILAPMGELLHNEEMQIMTKTPYSG